MSTKSPRLSPIPMPSPEECAVAESFLGEDQERVPVVFRHGAHDGRKGLLPVPFPKLIPMRSPNPNHEEKRTHVYERTARSIEIEGRSFQVCQHVGIEDE